MIKVQGSPAFTAVCVLALAGVLATDARGQAAGAGTAGANAAQRGSGRTVGVDPASSVNAEDMRLWSFGDCARVFPYATSDQYKQCVSVVGSDEAKEARAYRFCQTSFEKDPAEAARCKSAYRENQMKAAQDGRLSNTSLSAPLPPEVLQRVRTIASAGAERDRVTQEDGTAGTAPPAPNAGTQVATASIEPPLRATTTNAANLAAASLGTPNATPPSAAVAAPPDRDSFGAFLVERMWTIIFLLMTFVLLGVRHFNSRRKAAP